MVRFFPSTIAASLLALASLAACGDSEDAKPVGVNDVRKACDIRKTWPRVTSDQCIACQSAAPTVECTCPDYKDFAGKCQHGADAIKAEPTCTTEIDICVKKCASTDCDCIDACYAQAEACKRATGARDGCVAEICAQYCN